jgi:3-isopropylmalate/(R)-2-methylmalate dehydratase small subunit
MEKFTTHTGRVVPLRRSNVDTDQIIPAHWLKKVTRTGFEDGLFESWRKDENFVLNQPQYAGASILVAGPEFGTGSSREHAVWALENYGFRAVEQIWALVEADPTVEVTVDLEAREVRTEGITASFELDENVRWRLLNGLDDIGITLQQESEIASFEATRPTFKPDTTPVG